MEFSEFQVKTKWCRNIGEEVDFRKALNLFDTKSEGQDKPFGCLHAGECQESVCRWKNGSHNDPLVNIEEEFEM